MDQISPTKTNFISLKNDLKTAKSGFELLQQKKEILIIEIMKFVDRTRVLEREFTMLFADTYEIFQRSMVANDKTQIIEGSFLSPSIINLNIVEKKLIGLSLPGFKIQFIEDVEKDCNLYSNAAEDILKLKFKETLKMVVEYVEIKSAVIKLSKELKKTNRRVNALEKIMIPDFVSKIHYIDAVLDEAEKNEVFRAKMIKKRRSAND